MKIIGVCGRKRHGKDQIAQYLMPYGYKRIAFADELKRMAMEIWELSFEQMYGAEHIREGIDSRWGLSPRQIMQTFGTEVGRVVHIDTWVRKTITNIWKTSLGETIFLPNLTTRRFEPCTGGDMWVITDVRFPSEAQAVRDVGGTILKVIRPGLISEDRHTSETSVDEVSGIEILNDSDLLSLERKVQTLVKGLLR